MSNYHHPAETLRTETFRATISNSLKSTKSSNPDYYNETYDFICENAHWSLDVLMIECLVVIGCSKETFSRAVQVYILTQN